MSVKFVSVDGVTPSMLPAGAEDYAPEGRLARFVVEIAAQPGLGDMTAAYYGRGSMPCHPSMMARLCRFTAHSITSDNGKEFTRHELISENLETDFYFARPYRSGDRGLRENTIGLLRQYFAKYSGFPTIAKDRIAEAAEKLNNRPRRGLGFKTPNQLFFGTDPPVALRV